MKIFENSLDSSKSVQIEFWIAEKIAIEHLTWNPKNHENSWSHFLKITNIGVKVHFWPDFKKVKKWILLDIFSRKGPMTLKMCGKKTYDPSGFSPEIFFYLTKNWQKYWQLESCHFFFDHTVSNLQPKLFLWILKMKSKQSRKNTTLEFGQNFCW